MSVDRNVKFNEIETKEDMIYLAGLIDGCGVFGFSKSSSRSNKGTVYNTWVVNLIMGISHPGVHEELKRIFGVDRVYKLKRDKCNIKNCLRRDEHHHCKSKWLFNARILRHLLDKTIHLIKGPHIKAYICLEVLRTFSSSYGMKGVPPKLLERREELLEQWKLLRPKESGRYRIM